MRIIFSKVASRSYEDILEFLSQTWTEKEMGIFIDEAEKVTNQLKEGKFLLFQKYSKDIRSALIGKKHVRMFFRKESETKIKVLLFFDMRQDPQKILDLLQ
ncbi:MULTISPECIES: type II toxin-antitoxin system RelE/ParE family toxin [unclassified Chryseobacterium]|uniref:type II toxin-antitoxin system RelE/ParE family toxin n=1 Tax=unclassified Chryseobacterium TaxID=2593645 RepID=UPI00301A2584